MIAIINTYNKYYSIKREDNIIYNYYKGHLINVVDCSNCLFHMILRKIIYDKNMNMIKIKYSNGIWWSFIYDANNNLIREERSCGKWKKWSYNNYNRKIKYECSDGQGYDFDDDGNIIKK